MRPDTVWQMATVVVLLCVASFVAGAVTALLVYDRLAERATRLVKFGRAKAPATASHVPGGEMESLNHPTKERGDAQEAYNRVVEQGAEKFMELEPGLTKDEARLKARRALAEVGAFVGQMGGIPSA